nr:MAG TPA: major outer capsid protein [Caudoviricetes sp.]
MTLIYKVMYIIAIDLFNLIFDSVSRRHRSVKIDAF